MTRPLSRLLRPQSVAVIGGGAWCASVIEQLQRAGFGGDIWPVHPNKQAISGLPAFAALDALPAAPDAAFVGINRDATISAVGALSAQGAGGAVCFASGFAEVSDGQDRSAALLDAAGDMPILGPNCYGLINALDGALLWPDQHGCEPAQSGVAILTQSSNIAINLTMQNRGLPLAYVVTCGNQAQTSQADIASALLDDTRVTAIGLHIEGFGDIAAWQGFARKARDRGIAIVALKVGRSEQAQTATVSHTASMAGSDAAARALMDRFGFAVVDDLEVYLETLNILHIAGPMRRGQIATISCSGGEASLAADIAAQTGLRLPALTQAQTTGLAAALGPKVTLANPLDYHTYIWRDTAAMTDAFAAMVDPGLDLTILIVDFPREDRCDPGDWDCVITAALATRQRTGGQIAICATLPELMPEHVAKTLAAGEVIPMRGLRAGLLAVAAAKCGSAQDLALDLSPFGAASQTRTLTEAESKTALARHGLRTPKSIAAPTIGPPLDLQFPVVLKGTGFAHKTEHNAVALNIPTQDALVRAAQDMAARGYLVEEMITGTVAELLVAVTCDPAHGLMLTLGAGGTLAELWADTTHLMLPASDAAIRDALSRLKIAQVLRGYRGQPAADIAAICTAVSAIQDYALANAASLQEVEVNPLICTPKTAIAADALIRISHD